MSCDLPAVMKQQFAVNRSKLSASQVSAQDHSCYATLRLNINDTLTLGAVFQIRSNIPVFETSDTSNTDSSLDKQYTIITQADVHRPTRESEKNQSLLIRYSVIGSKIRRFKDLIPYVTGIYTSLYVNQPLAGRLRRPANGQACGASRVRVMSRKRLACERLVPTHSQLASLVARACDNSCVNCVQQSIMIQVMIEFNVLNRAPSTHFTLFFSNSSSSIVLSACRAYSSIYLSPLIPLLHSPSPLKQRTTAIQESQQSTEAIFLQL